MKTNGRASIRKRAGLTQHRLAKLAGICASTISLWENHELELPPEVVERLGHAIARELNKVPATLTVTEAVKVLSSPRNTERPAPFQEQIDKAMAPVAG